ncbi:uncharacterized protein LOC111051778 isoform X5 [Nilaparvata lugens]|uniref:uncharacterized protein LOC111051778 isoform X5 n=1 Tax=Nilaparvata lugens TaxID=108931 RepID=UPI00193E6FB3|nr:uncharacterized protein LOC111051778 isoform X5 [Nilaparvata lugens]XP_039283357.1 uncharacterized protein LOC111051778 isoform X5 [Nilaparvata lugens]XP_039283358.1 uncharacterized protein LOC111051778 isoform X5 [Nilaparvata lugens]
MFIWRNRSKFRYSRQKSGCIGSAESTRSGCNTRRLSILSRSNMAGPGGSGKSKTPEDLKQDIDNLIGKAQNVVSDLMNPQVQEELKKRILQTTEQNLSQALNEFQKIMKNVQDDVILKSDENLPKHKVDMEQLKKDLESVVKSLSDPVVLQKVAKNLRAAMSLMNQSLQEAGEKVKAGTSAVKDNEQLKLMVDRAVIMIDQMKGSEKAVELAKNVTNAIRDGSEAAHQKLKKCMDESSQELGVKSDQVFKKYKESVKSELDDLMGQANELAAKMKDPIARKEFLNEVKETVSRESINVVKNVRELLENGKKKLEAMKK